MRCDDSTGAQLIISTCIAWNSYGQIGLSGIRAETGRFASRAGMARHVRCDEPGETQLPILPCVATNTYEKEKDSAA